MLAQILQIINKNKPKENKKMTKAAFVMEKLARTGALGAGIGGILGGPIGAPIGAAIGADGGSEEKTMAALGGFGGALLGMVPAAAAKMVVDGEHPKAFGAGSMAGWGILGATSAAGAYLANHKHSNNHESATHVKKD